MVFKILSLVLIPCLGWTQLAEPKKPAPPPLTHTLIDSTVMKTQNQKDCELIAAVSLDNKTVHVMRIDHPRGTYNSTYLTKTPQMFKRYGTEYVISDLLGGDLEVRTVQASFDFTDNYHDVIFKIHLKNGAVVDKKVSLETEFFRDKAAGCLK